MTSFHSIENYASVLVFFFGVLTCSGFAGTGLAILRLFKITPPFPWSLAAGVLLGIQTGSLLVQMAGMTGLASHGLLVSAWFVMVFPGLAYLVSAVVTGNRISFSLPCRWSLIVAVPVSLAILVNLVAALAPSTKIDELYYHMLLPSRIVNDHALLFYRYPLESAALPQMIFQFSLTPLHAMGFPDAGNVVSLGLNLVLMILGWHLIRRHGGSETWAWLWVAPLCIGMYPVIWQVTGGASAMGDLATSAAILALLLRNDLLKKLPAEHYYFLFSIFVLGSVSSKLSLLPAGLVMMLINGFLLFRTESLKNRRIRISGIMSLPWLVFYLPVIVWTWQASGSPFGPFLQDFPGVYRAYIPEVLQFQLHQMKAMNVLDFAGTLKASLIDYTPLLWFGVVMIFPEKTIPPSTKIMILLLLILQAVVVTGFLFFDLRFFGGLIQGLALFFAVIASVRMQQNFTGNPRRVMAIMLFLIIPWLTIQLYYSTQFIGIVTGCGAKNEFYGNKTSFFKDYRSIDGLIPEDAVILFSGAVRLNTVYAPRAVCFAEADIPAGKTVYLMIVGSHLNPGDRFGHFRLGEKVYENNRAIIEVFRTTGTSPRSGNLKVFKLSPY